MPGWQDLTRPLHPGMPVFSSGAYRDVDTGISPWCTIAEQGFATQRLVLGTQAGTHLDAPAHFVVGGATLDALDPAAGIGRYTVLSDPGTVTRHLDRATTVPVLDTRGWPPLSPDRARTLALAAPDLIVLLGQVPVRGPDPHLMNRALAEHDTFVVEDLPEDAAARLGERGDLVIAWPALVGTGGAPCRVLARPT